MLNPVYPATVSASGRQAQTNPSGFFEISGASTGTVSFTVSATMYDTLIESRTLVTGSNDLSSVPFYLHPARLGSNRGSVSGTVQNMSGAPVADATISIQTGGQPFSAKSKTSGAFTVYNVLYGYGNLSAVGSAGSYGPATINVDEPQEVLPSPIVLTSGPPPPPW